MKKLSAFYILLLTFNLCSQTNEALYISIQKNYANQNWNSFHKNRLIFLKKFKDTTTTYAYVLDYSGAYFSTINRKDSAYYYYYKSHKTFEKIGDTLSSSKMLLNLAIIQKNSRDYLGSESSSFKALRYFLKTDEKRIIASIYNNLGIIYNYSKDYTNSIKYHSKALEIRETLDDAEHLVIHSLNNMGNVYREMADYEDAIKSFNKGLSYNDLLDKNQRVFAMLLDNLAYTYLLQKNYTNLPQLFFKAQKIRNSINDVPGIIRSSIHIGLYYQSLNDLEKAESYFEKGLQLAKEIKNIDDELEALDLLKNIYPKEQSNLLLQRIILIKDSIYKSEKFIKQEISKVEFETVEKEKTIADQQQNLSLKNKVISLLIFIFCLLIGFIGFLFYKKQKQKKEFQKGFTNYLINKYNLTERNLEFWEALQKGAYSEEKLAAILFLSIDGVKSRRKALFSKLKKTKKSSDSFDKAKAIILYKQEIELYKKTIKA